MDMSDVKISPHCSWRQEQRNISKNEILKTVNEGVKVDFGTNVHYNENHRVVMKNQTVVTVMENKRNTRFNILNLSKSKVESLRYEVEVKNNDYAMCELADVYLEGHMGKRDPAKAQELFLRAAELGNSHAMCKLSMHYKVGTFGKKDEELSKKWMEKSADRGNVYALGVTGQELLAQYRKEKDDDGDVTPGLKDKILFYLEKAIYKGSSRAMWALANIYESGDFEEKNIPKAVELYSKAAKIGSPASVESLHQFCNECLFRSDALEDILNSLVPRLTKSSVGMLQQIGENQLMSLVGFSRSRGLNMIEAAALKNYDDAILKLAKCYRDGVACKPNLRLCQYWYNMSYNLYETSANQGNVDSLWTLGKYHMKGYAGEIDLAKAENCFKKAHLLSDKSKFSVELGMMYLNGCLGDRDPQIGEVMIRELLLLKGEAARNNDVDACYYLGRFYQYNPLFRSYEKAKYWLSHAVHLDSQIAEFNLALLFLNKASGYTDIELGLQIIEKHIYGKLVSIQTSFEIILVYLNSQDVAFVSWLEEKSKITTKDENILNQVKLDKLIESNLRRSCLILLSSAFNSGNLKVECSKGCSYSYQLFSDFEDASAMFNLSDYYLLGELPDEHSDIVTNWILNLPNLLEQSQDFKFFIMGASLLGHCFKKGKVFPANLKEAAKWLGLVKCIKAPGDKVDSLNILETLEEEFSSITQDHFESEFIIDEIGRMARHYKNASSLVIYRILSRVLGDIYLYGFLAKQNTDEAIRWYSESSVLNNARASLSLARIYRLNENKMNSYHALKYFKLAIKQGSEIAVEEFISFIEENEMFKTHLAFLHNYQHRSSVSEDEINRVLPFKQLPKYPKSVDEIRECAMDYLSRADKHGADLNNAVYWFRKASKYQPLESAVELFKIYKSGMLGQKVIPVAKNIIITIMDISMKRMMKIKRVTSMVNGKNKGKEDLESTVTALKKLTGEAIFQDVISSMEHMLSTDDINVVALDGIIFNFNNLLTNNYLM